MATVQPVKSLTIKGFKSIRNLENLELRDLNVLIGANGTGKSNFISFFTMLHEMVEERLQLWATRQGSADRILSFGTNETKKIVAEIKFGLNGYRFTLVPGGDDRFTFSREDHYFHGVHFQAKRPWLSLGSGHSESKLREAVRTASSYDQVAYCYDSISDWKLYHFHDTSDSAGVKQKKALHDNVYLRSDASNLAAFLYRLMRSHPNIYQKIIKTINLAIPSFDDFVLAPEELETGEQLIKLLWRQKGSDYPFWPSQLSDGSLRFICLVTVLLQPNPPSTIIIDEPELGLHPYAINLLGSLLRSVTQSKQMQVIIGTQSVSLVNEFSVDDLIIVELENEETVFKRFSENELQHWLTEYSVGELWEKNILGGRPG